MYSVQKDTNNHPRYAAGLINIKHIHGLQYPPNNTEWQQYKTIEGNCSFLDSSLMHVLVTIYVFITKDKQWENEYMQELKDCETFKRALNQLEEKYPHKPK